MPYVYGRCAFEDISDALATATSPEHRIYLVGWWVEPWTRLRNPISGPPPTNPLLQDYLRSSQAQVRGLFWDTPLKGKPGDNKAIVEYINSLPNGAAIEDGKLPKGDPPLRGPGAHHQKLVVVVGSFGPIAFLGGMDLQNSRVDAVDPKEPLHDVHVRITGQATASCLMVIRDRWLDHPKSAALDQNKFKMSRSDVQRDFGKGLATPSQPIDTVTNPRAAPQIPNALVSIGKTCPKLSKFNPGEHYSFAREGDQSAWQLVKNGINRAKRWIYVEDQYFVSRRAREELLKKFKEPTFEFLLILTSDSRFFEWTPNLIPPENEFPYLIGSRNEFRADLTAIDPQRKRWRMFVLAPSSDSNRRPWCGSFVHSKLWICDDEYVAVGSANCDDRGYTYDSEIMAGIVDAPFDRAAGSRFARDLRIALWRKHLGVPHSQVQDFSKGLKFWLTPPPSSMIVDASELEHSPLLGGKRFTRTDQTVDNAWTHLIDPDADKL